MGIGRVQPFVYAVALCACQGAVSGPAAPPEAAMTGPAGSAAAGSAANATGTAGTPGASGAAGAAAGSALEADSGELPARLRRLTNAEFDASVKALLGIDSKFGANFTPDTRQDGFTRNAAQRVDPVFMTQLDAAAQQIAAQARDKVDQLAPCSDSTGSEACARSFIQQYEKRAYRRPPTAREVDALLTVYRAGADGASYADGIVATLTALLESPGFLYVTEIGDATPTSPTTLTDYEIASELSYLLTGGPPDDALLQAADAGQLRAADTRMQQARRLLSTDAAGAQITRVVQQWLGIDRISETAKDSVAYPDYEGLRDAMQREADSFVSEVMWKSGQGVRTLLSADWTDADDALARMYLNLPADQPVPRQDGKVSLTSVPRRGILNQAAFLSVYAHANETAPVLRGVALLRRLLCRDVPAPTSLNINIVPPVPDPNKTTRERFTIHSKDAVCAGCHVDIDALGFTFENLDGMGRERQTENGHPIDSSSHVAGGFSFDAMYADSSGLVAAMADSPEVASCFARHMFRYAAATSGAALQGAETNFMSAADALPTDAQGKFADVLLAFIASDVFIQRGAAP